MSNAQQQSLGGGGNNNIDPATFIYSLPQDIREEVLMTSESEFLNQLPQDLQDEARRLQESRRRFQQPEDLLIGRQNEEQFQHQMHHHINRNQQQQQQQKKQLQQIKPKPTTQSQLIRQSDINKINKWIYTDEKLIEAILQFIYYSKTSFVNFPFAILKFLLYHPQTEQKVIDCLLFLLKNKQVNLAIQNYYNKINQQNIIATTSINTLTFPQQQIYEQTQIIRNYKEVYSQISLKILFLLQKFSQNFLSYFFPDVDKKDINQAKDEGVNKNGMEQDNENKLKSQNNKIQFQLQCLKPLRQELENINDHNKDQQSQQLQIVELDSSMSAPAFATDNLQSLILLLNENTFNQSNKHISLIVQLLSDIIKQFKKKQLEQQQQLEENNIKQIKLSQISVQTLCNILSSNVIDDQIQNIISQMILELCLERKNLDYFISELKNIIFKISNHVNILLNNNLEYLRTLVQEEDITKHMEKLNKESEMQFMFEMSKKLSVVIHDQDSQQLQQQSQQQKINLDDRTFLKQLENEIQEELRILKILEIIKQLFEKQNALEKQKLEKKQELELKQQSPLKTDNSANKQEQNELIIQLEKQPSSFDKAKEKVKQGFSSLINDESLYALWINVTELVTILNIKFPQLLKQDDPLYKKIKPIIESFFIIYKIINDEEETYQSISKSQKKLQSQSQDSQFLIQTLINVEKKELSIAEQTFSQIRNQKIEIEDLFKLVCEKNKKIINMIIKEKPKIMNDQFKMILKKMPKVLDFENKRLYFQSQLKMLRDNQRHNYYNNSIKLSISRSNIFRDSYQQFMQYKTNELRGKISVKFKGEDGLDAGGLTREWFICLSKEIFNPDYNLFVPSNTSNTYQPSSKSMLDPDHLKYFEFIGKVFGKALLDGHLMEAFFTRSFYKHILKQPLTLYDFEDIDYQVLKNLQSLLDLNESDFEDLGLNFSYEEDNFGELKVKDLIKDGQNIKVTYENKEQYIQEMCYAKMAKSIEEQIKSFLKGFHELIPSDLISIFNEKELELMISGLPDIDVEDLKQNAEYSQYSAESKQIKWLWEILSSMDRQDRAGFIQFVTGTSKVPIGGFSYLRGMNGPQKFQITKAYDTTKLPASHTCFNQLDLPEYPTKEMLKEKLTIAIQYGKEGFGFR